MHASFQRHPTRAFSHLPFAVAKSRKGQGKINAAARKGEFKTADRRQAARRSYDKPRQRNRSSRVECVVATTPLGLSSACSVPCPKR